MVATAEAPASLEQYEQRQYYNLIPPELVSLAIEQRRDSAQLAYDGALIVETGEDTGRSPKDKYFVLSDPNSGLDIGEKNKPLNSESFDQLCGVVDSHLASQAHLFQQDLSFGADPEYSRNVEVLTENAWSALFSRNLLLPSNPRAFNREDPITVLHAPSLKLHGEIPGIVGDKAIAIDFARRMVVIAGTRYAGEIKKAIFTMAQGIYPDLGIGIYHCSANRDQKGNTALFFGLSGTGKTTLSMDKGRWLIGDDEHAWSDKGIFNLEGGSYAKVKGIKQEKEEEIWKGVQRYGSVLENVTLDAEGNPLFSDKNGEENMRGAFPLAYFGNVEPSGMGDHPKHIIFLTADATGVMPIAAKLNQEQAIYHFLSGYTSKMPNTEKGVSEPTPEFSACYGAPFLAYPVQRYAEIFAQQIQEVEEIWMVNTGWAGEYAKEERMDIDLTRAVIRGILNGKAEAGDELDGLGFRTVQEVEGVPFSQLQTRNHFRDEQNYLAGTKKLAAAFAENHKQYEGIIPRNILAAAPAYNTPFTLL